MTTTVVQPPAGERVATTGRLRRLLIRPEIGALFGAIVVLVFFSILSDTFRSADGVANWLDPASTLGIMAVAVGLLMIGGEFDLSAGVQTGTAALTVAILSTKYHVNVWLAILIALGLALAIGYFNGIVVTRTKLPSFIITLGTFLGLQGINLGLTKALTGTVLVSGLANEGGFTSAHFLFASSVKFGSHLFHVSIVWWILLTIAASYLLLRSRFGNWIFASGGDDLAARNVGVPADRTKIQLFMGVSVAAWLVGTIGVLRFNGVQASQGIGQELIYIVAAVIGGCLLTGGYGSVVGASLGALIFGMVSQGIVYVHWDNNWFKLFLGVMLLIAVLANTYLRRYAERSRR